MTLDEDAINLSKAVLLLDKYGFIHAMDDEDEDQCAHLRSVAVHHARAIQKKVTEKDKK